MLASKFQLFCRDLHTEAVERMANAASPAPLQHVLRESLLGNRQLDSKNAQPGSLGSDFKRLQRHCPPDLHEGKAAGARTPVATPTRLDVADGV